MDGPKYTKFNIFSDIYTPFQEIHPEVFRRPMYQGHPDASHREIFSWAENWLFQIGQTDSLIIFYKLSKDI